jgi:hypothetical protein
MTQGLSKIGRGLDGGGPDLEERLITALVSGLLSLLGFASVWAVVGATGAELDFRWVLIGGLVIAVLGYRFPRRFPRWLEKVLGFCAALVSEFPGRRR